MLKNKTTTLVLRNTLILLTSVSFTFTDIVTFSYSCFRNEAGPKLYGFPFIYRTEIPWVNSLEGNLYVFGLLGNMVFYFFSINLLVLGIRILNSKLMTNIIIKTLFISITSLLIIFGFLTILMHDWELYLTTEQLLEHADEPIKCDRELILLGK